MSKPINRITGFLQKRDAIVFDVSDPWEIPNTPIWVREGKKTLYLEVLNLKDGNLTITWGTQYGPSRATFTTETTDVPDETLEEIVSFLKTQKKWLDDYAVITKSDGIKYQGGIPETEWGKEF